jgi:CHAT domain-containing protein/Tfp pilus assembly protein PilF
MKMLRQSRMFLWLCVLPSLGMSAAPVAVGGALLLRAGDHIKVGPAAVNRYRLRTPEGKFFRLTVDQHDLDTSVTVDSPSKGNLTTADEFDFGRDTASFLSAADEVVTIRVKVLARHATDAFYTLGVDLPREPGEAEARLLGAERLATALKAAIAGAARKDYPRLIEEGRRAAAAWHAAGDWEAEADAMLETGDVLLNNGEVSNARDEYLLALTLALEHGIRPAAAAAANGAGYCELQLGSIPESEGHLKQALDTWKDLKSRYNQMAAFNNLGMWRKRTGDYGGARQAYQAGLKLVYWQDRQVRGLLVNNIGLMHLSLGEYSHAIADLSQASDLLSEADPGTRSRTLMNLGRAHLLRGQTAEAIRFCERALSIAPAQDRKARADILNNLGQAFGAARKPGIAQQYLERAADLYVELKDSRGQASVAHHRGLVAAASGQTGTAVELLQEAAKTREEAGLRDDAADSLFALAQVAGGRDELANALTFAERSMTIVESLRTTIPGESSRASYFSSKQPLYEFSVDLLVRLHQANPAAEYGRRAFEVFERSRARTLLEALRQGRLDLRRGVDPSVLSRARLAQQTLSFKVQELIQLMTGPHAASDEVRVRSAVAKAERDYEEAETEIRAQNPEYSRLVSLRPRTTKEIQDQVLDANTILLEYSQGERNTYLWAVTRDSMDFFTLGRSARLKGPAGIVSRLAGEYRMRARKPELEQRYRRAAAQLSRTLLGPVVVRIRGKRLVVVTSGFLQTVPFAALASPDETISESLPLGVTHELVSMDSASALAEIRELHRARRAADLTLAVFADPVFDARDPRVVTSRPPAVGSRIPLPRLPFTRHEALQILQLTPPEMALAALGFDANRELLSQPEIGRYRYLHIATHALLDPADLSRTGLVLSQMNRDGSTRSGFLGLNEIYDLPRLTCELVALPDCNTGQGRDVRGEGLIGLARGFFYAGSPRVLVSLWACEDSATAELMKLFYGEMLGAGKASPAAALLLARQAFWRRGGRWRDPYFSAGFVLHGEYR